MKPLSEIIKMFGKTDTFTGARYVNISRDVEIEEMLRDMEVPHTYEVWKTEKGGLIIKIERAING